MRPTWASSSDPGSEGFKPSSVSTARCSRAVPGRFPRSSSPRPSSILRPARSRCASGQGSEPGHVSACSASAHAIGEAFDIIRRGHADVMICRRLGGRDHADGRRRLCRDEDALHAQRRSEPGVPSVRQGPRRIRPRRRRRHAGAGGARARPRRGANIYGELVGYGVSADAYHITAPSEDGDGNARAMRMALRKAGLKPEEIDYINAHGTSTQHNDRSRPRRSSSSSATTPTSSRSPRPSR